MNLAKLTNVLDLFAGISAAPEIIGKERLQSLEERADRVVHQGRLFSPRVYLRWLDHADDTDNLASFLLGAAVLVSAILLTLSPLSMSILLRLGLVKINLLIMALVIGFWLLVSSALISVGVLLAAPLVRLISQLLSAIADRTELSRSMLLLGFFLFVLSGVVKIAFL